MEIRTIVQVTPTIVFDVKAYRFRVRVEVFLTFLTMRDAYLSYVCQSTDVSMLVFVHHSLFVMNRYES